MKKALDLITNKLSAAIKSLAAFAKKNASLPCLSYTHLQPAQPTTVGKRATLWLQDFLLDLKELARRSQDLPFLGAKGATGTQASFLSLFKGDEKKVEQLDAYLAKEMGFSKLLTISSQTYPRKLDHLILSSLASLGSSTHKIASDIRLLAHLKEVEEPFAKTQVGSSAMPHKRNPIRSERVCSLARYLISLSENPAYTAAEQWLERTLDDSASRRCYLPEAFLCADALINELYHLITNLVIYPKVIAQNLAQEIPSLSLEIVLMEAAKKGKDRQLMHERLRKHALKARKDVDLFEVLSQDPEIPFSKVELMRMTEATQLIGRAPAQVSQFLDTEVLPFLSTLPKRSLKIPAPTV